MQTASLVALPRSAHGARWLREAAWKNDSNALRELLSSRGTRELNFHDTLYRTPLDYSVRRGLWRNVKVLLAIPGIAIAFADNKGLSPLHKAAHQGNERIVKLLLDAGACVHGVVRPKSSYARCNGSERNFVSPLTQALRRGHISIVKLLLARGSRASWKDIRALNTLSERLARHLLPLLLAAGANINEGRSTFCTALQYACERGNFVFGRTLIDYGYAVQHHDVRWLVYNQQNLMLLYLFHHSADFSVERLDTMLYQQIWTSTPNCDMVRTLLLFLFGADCKIVTSGLKRHMNSLPGWHRSWYIACIVALVLATDEDAELIQDVRANCEITVPLLYAVLGEFKCAARTEKLKRMSSTRLLRIP